MWREHYPQTVANGTLVVAMARDAGEIDRFAAMTDDYQRIDGAQLATLEPDLTDRFSRGLFYKNEAHVEAMSAMRWLLNENRRLGGEISFGASDAVLASRVIDCRGIAAERDLSELRGVRGERLLIETTDVNLSRPVRLLHPRQPIYVVPQAGNRFVVGATVVERSDDEPMTVKSALDLLGAAYALNPGFGEAKILEMAAGVRPAFPDNVPRVLIEPDGRTIRVNGAYRHGFLLAPVLARAVSDFLSTSRRECPLICDA
jgi:glycine oxidase